jgi:hypothetical protein
MMGSTKLQQIESVLCCWHQKRKTTAFTLKAELYFHITEMFLGTRDSSLSDSAAGHPTRNLTRQS